MPKIDLGPTDKRLGEYIREYRESRYLSQPMIARVLDIDQQQLSRYENGVNRVSLHLSVMLADVFGQTMNEFVSASHLFRDAIWRIEEAHTQYQWEADASSPLNLLRLPDVVDRGIALNYFNRLKRRTGIRQTTRPNVSSIDPSEIPEPIFRQYFLNYFRALERYSIYRLSEEQSADLVLPDSSS